MSSTMQNTWEFARHWRQSSWWGESSRRKFIEIRENVFSTIVLVGLVVKFHVHEIQVELEEEFDFNTFTHCRSSWTPTVQRTGKLRWLGAKLCKFWWKLLHVPFARFPSHTKCMFHQLIPKHYFLFILREVSTVNSDGQTIPMKMPLDVLFSISENFPKKFLLLFIPNFQWCSSDSTGYVVSCSCILGCSRMLLHARLLAWTVWRPMPNSSSKP